MPQLMALIERAQLRERRLDARAGIIHEAAPGRTQSAEEQLAMFQALTGA